MKHFINLKDIPVSDLRKIILDDYNMSLGTGLAKAGKPEFWRAYEHSQLVYIVYT